MPLADDQIEQFKHICMTTTLSYRDIAERFGMTRSGAIGKAYRLGVHKLRPKVVRERCENPKHRKMGPMIVRGRPVSRERLVPLSEPFEARTFVSSTSPTGPVCLEELESPHCRWPTGHGRETTYCGGQIVIKPRCPSYCEAHYRAAYVLG